MGVMSKSSIQTTTGRFADTVKHLGLPDDTPVEITIQLSDDEKIVRLNALLAEAEDGKAMLPEPVEERLERLHAAHPKA